MRLLSEADQPSPDMAVSGDNHHDAADPMLQPPTISSPSFEAFMQPSTAIPVEPMASGTVSSLVPVEEPPPPSTEVKTHPSIRYHPSLEVSPPPPPQPSGFLAPPHAPLLETETQVSLPPLMLINGSSPPVVLSPPTPKSNSNMPPHSLVGLVVGTSAGVTGAFFILALIIFCVCLIKKKNYGHFEYCQSSSPRDSFYSKVSDKLNQKVPPIGVHLIPAPGKIFSVPPTISNDGSSSPSYPEFESQFSPQGRVAGLGVSGGNFTYKELAKATNGFSPANLLGEGGFGYVHKGVLPNGRKIAVKQLKIGSQQGEREFQAEVETITRLHHRHLVSLVGYCITGSKRLLVYEFVCNGTLEFHLHGKQQPVMDWATRMKIAIGSAKGLAYLHEDCNPTIIHRDIKAANILLDSNFEPKVSDFGLAKFFCDSNHYITHVSTRVVGTFGYLAPEYAQSGKVSDKSDVYSYGVMLLELITGSQPIIEMESTMGLVSWARPLLRQALEDRDYDTLVDPHLHGNYNDKELANMASCAAACVHHSSRRRPRMIQIVRALEGDASLMDLDEEITPGQSSLFFDYQTEGFSMSEFYRIFNGGQNGVRQIY